ncbi:MAG: tetratricopeptide repeat protein [Acidobacteriota bacterium]|nr:tetratricopeptide repeat protein [Acidobacteriota bacterium]
MTIVLLAIALGFAQSASNSALSKADIAKLLRGGVAMKRVTALVEERGVDFPPTDSNLQELKRSGADAALLEAVRNSIARELSEAQALIESDQFANAEQRFRALVARAPQNSRAHLGLADTLGWESKWPEALPEYREAVRLDPESAPAHRGLGRGLANANKDIDGAITEMRQALRLKYDYAEGHASLGSLLRRKKEKDIEGAFYEAREAVRLGPDLGHTHFVLADLLLEEKKDLDGALAEYRAAVRIGGAYGRLAEKGVADVSYVKKDYYGAAAAYREILRRSPQDSTAHYGLGHCLQAVGDNEGALREYQETVRENPSAAWAYNSTGVILDTVKKDTDGALNAFAAAVRLDASVANYHHNLAIILNKKTRYPEALQEYRKAAELEPANTQYREHADQMKKYCDANHC